jgi:hypothetical protein
MTPNLRYNYTGSSKVVPGRVRSRCSSVKNNTAKNVNVESGFNYGCNDRVSFDKVVEQIRKLKLMRDVGACSSNSSK